MTIATHLTVTEISQLIGAAAAMLATLWAIAIWIAARVCRKRADEIIAATTGAIQKFIASQMDGLIANRDPKSYYTLDLQFPGGESLQVPMISGVPVQALENISITVTSHCTRETIATLVCKGFGHIPSHAHKHHHESVTVISGVVTDLVSGRIYREGEKWEIEPGQFHAATFQNCVLILRYTPPLLTAHARPVDLAAMDKVFANA
jgi:hypothetical protein